MSCVRLKYFEDPFLGYFVMSKERRPPLINRGYFARYAAVDLMVSRFLQLCAEGSVSEKAQIVVLGAGFDTMPFRLFAGGFTGSYFELDMDTVTTRKTAMIAKQKELMGLIASPGEESSSSINKDSGEIICTRYKLLPCDLRSLPTVQDALINKGGIDCSAPTLFISECVLIYIEPELSATLTRWLGETFPTAACVAYEQILPDDPFGQVMLRNLESRGCPLRGIHGFPDLGSQKARYSSNGWQNSGALDMNQVYDRCLNPADLARITRLEIFDEFEEWKLIQAHYCLSWGVNNATGILGQFNLKPRDTPAFPTAAKFMM